MRVTDGATCVTLHVRPPRWLLPRGGALAAVAQEKEASDGQCNGVVLTANFTPPGSRNQPVCSQEERGSGRKARVSPAMLGGTSQMAW